MLDGVKVRMFPCLGVGGPSSDIRPSFELRLPHEYGDISMSLEEAALMDTGGGGGVA